MILLIGNNLVVRRTQYAFTLVEIMISIAVLSIGLVLILQGFAHSLNVLRISEDYLKAGFLAENKFAEAQIQAKEDWGTFKDGLDEEFKFEDIKCAWKVKVDPVEWELKEVPESYKYLNEVKAALSWKEGRRRGIIPLVTFMVSPIEKR